MSKVTGTFMEQQKIAEHAKHMSRISRHATQLAKLWACSTQPMCL